MNESVLCLKTLLRFVALIEAAGAPPRTIEKVLEAGLRRLASQAEQELGHLVPRRAYDNLRGDPSLN